MENNIYFTPGLVVLLRLDVPNKPLMIVVRKEASLFKHNKHEDKKPVLMGIRCRWFTTTGELQEAVFNTKDLILISK